MSKPLPKKTVKRDHPSKPPLIPEKYQDSAFILLLLVSVFIFLFSAISGGGFNEFDNVASMSFGPYIQKAAHDGNFPLWIPYIFGGMPSYPALLITGERLWDIVPQIFFGFSVFFRTLFGSDTARVAVYYAIYGAGIFLFMRYKKHDRFISFISAFAATFSTWVITWVMIGHNTKPVVFAMFPFIFFFMEKLREKFSLIYAVLLIFAIHIMLEGGHLQMIFYGACAFGLYLLFEFISRLISKDQPLKVLMVAGLLVIGFGSAYLMSADRYMAVQDYTPYSTRGSAPIAKTAQQHQDASGGNDYQYATMWSYSPGEVLTLFVPSYFGYGTQDYQGDKVSTYWGNKESEDSPPYMGIGILALAIIGLFYFRKDTFVQFLLGLTIFSLLLGMGKNLPILYDFFYNNFPNFNKFRAPSMAFALMHFAVPLLAGYGIAAFYKMREDFTPKNKKIVMGFLIASGVFFVIAILFTVGFKNSYLISMANSKMFESVTKSYGPTISGELQNFNWSNMINDWFIGAALLIGVAVSCYLFVTNKLNKTLFFVALLTITVIDLWRVDFRRMEVSKESIKEGVFEKKAELFNFIKQDKSLFRVADFSSNPANIPAYYFVESINGYHAAKLRIYQDVMDNANGEQFAGSTSQLFNPFLWNIMNVKYIITNRPFPNLQPIFQAQASGDYVYPNPAGLPRAFFVKQAVIAKQMDILNHLKVGDFNPLDTVFVEKALASQIEPADSTAKAEVTDFKNESFKITANASGNNFLFISEIYYPAGWKAYVDGKETEIIKSNFAFRGLILSKGQHTVEMKFTSKGFETGKTLSIVVNILSFLALGFGIFLYQRNKKKDQPKITEEV